MTTYKLKGPNGVVTMIDSSDDRRALCTAREFLEAALDHRHALDEAGFAWFASDDGMLVLQEHDPREGAQWDGREVGELRLKRVIDTTYTSDKAKPV